MIYTLLSQNFDVGIYALFPQIFGNLKVDSADFFTFRMYVRYTCQLREFHYDRCINQTPKGLLETLYPSVLSKYRVLQDFLRPTLFWWKAPKLGPQPEWP